MRTVTPEVNKTVMYFRTLAGKSKWLPATVTGIVSGTTVNLRLCRTGTTFASVPLNRSQTLLVTNTWRPY